MFNSSLIIDGKNVTINETLLWNNVLLRHGPNKTTIKTYKVVRSRDVVYAVPFG